MRSARKGGAAMRYLAVVAVLFPGLALPAPWGTFFYKKSRLSAQDPLDGGLRGRLRGPGPVPARPGAETGALGAEFPRAVFIRRKALSVDGAPVRIGFRHAG